MKIAIQGSSAFCKEMVKYKEKLQALGHEVILHSDYEEFAAGRRKEITDRIANEHAAVKREYDYIRWHYRAIVDSDAILVLNFDKNGIKNYVGGNTLMEMGFAHVHNKKIFLLNPVPEIGYKDEIEAMVDVVLDGDLTKIK